MPPALLIVKDVSKSYDGFKAISELNFTLAEGELRTVIGPNGAGKSTFFDLISGRTRPDRGRIHFQAGIDLAKLQEYEISRLGIGRKFQTPSVHGEHTVWENLILSLKGPRSVFATLIYRLTSEDRDRLDEILRLINLSAKRESVADELSHGEKQWLEIGMLLATQPKLLLVDEPAAGMTDAETHRTGELLLALAGKHSLIVVEHDMAFVRQIARHGKVTVLHQGSVLCEGKFDEVQANPKVREVYLGRGQHGRK